MLVIAFLVVAALTVSQRSDLEQLVVASFSNELRDAAGREHRRAHCEKVETYHFDCLVESETLRLSYALRFEDSGCWRASARGWVQGDGPRRLRGCVSEAAILPR